MNYINIFAKHFIMLFIIIGGIKLIRLLINQENFNFSEFIINNINPLLLLSTIGAIILTIVKAIKNKKAHNKV